MTAAAGLAARPRIVAHRGGAALWPENSLLAFRHAIELGVDLVELDVHPTADGDVAVIHDATLERTTEGAGTVASVRARDLQAIRLRGPDGALTAERVPLLAEVLDVIAPSRVGLLVEIKSRAVAVRSERRDAAAAPLAGEGYEGLEERVILALEARGLRERATIMAFDPAVLERARARAPALRRAFLVARRHVERARDAIGWARGLAATDLGIEHTLVDEELVQAARAAGLLLGAWTVNDEAEMRRLAHLGLDILTTDRPDLAGRVLSESA